MALLRPAWLYRDGGGLKGATAPWLRRHRGGTKSQRTWATHGGCCKTRPSAVWEADSGEKIRATNRFGMWHIFRGASFRRFCNSLHASPLPRIGAARAMMPARRIGAGCCVMMQGVRWCRAVGHRIGAARAVVLQAGGGATGPHDASARRAITPVRPYARMMHCCGAWRDAAGLEGTTAPWLWRHLGGCMAAVDVSRRCGHERGGELIVAPPQYP